MTDERYPTGRFSAKGAPLTFAERFERIARIAALPADARAAVAGLTDPQLDTPYREGGWSSRRITHHLADSHLNAFVRFKLGLTEEVPTIKPYDQDAWAAMADSSLPVDVSLSILGGMHARWVALLEAMAPEDFGRKVAHPEMGDIDLDFLLDLYAWHGHHHTTQMVRLRDRHAWA